MFCFQIVDVNGLGDKVQILNKQARDLNKEDLINEQVTTKRLFVN